MTRSRTLSLVVLLSLLAVLSACGGSSGDSGSQESDDGGSGASQAEETQPATDDGDGGDDGSTGSFDLDRAFEALTPPNADELTKTTADGIIFAAWDTDESFDSLRSFYEDAMDDLGLEVVTTTEAQGGIAWAATDGDDSGVGATISIFPASDGSGTQVSVTIGEGAS